MPNITPTQTRMLEVLADGLPHTRQELHKCLNDELSPLTAIHDPISKLRKVLRPIGQDIVCELAPNKGGIKYRHVRLLGSTNQ